MADCPGVLHLAEMADGGLARVRTPGGRLTAAQACAAADLAERLGSGVIDVTNRANLQIRGLSLDAGPELAEGLSAAGLFVDGPADRRRNILLDPLAGLDPTELSDLTPQSEKLERALTTARWIERLSPKFSFVLDGAGRSGVAATTSDVGFLAASATPPDGKSTISLGGRRLGLAIRLDDVADAALAIARMAADAGPTARGRDLSREAVAESLRAAGLARTAEPGLWPTSVRPTFGCVETADPARAAIVVPVAVGRLDPPKLRWLADAARADGDGTLVLAPWSAVVVPGVASENAPERLAASERAGFPPVAVMARLTVVACAGAPACVRAREPAKAIGLAVLSAAAARPDLLPPIPRSVHISACAKGCAGAAPADLLLLGCSDADGFSLHAGGAPREPGRSVGRVTTVDPLDVLARMRTLG